MRKNAHKRVKEDGDQINLDSLVDSIKLDFKTISAHEGRKIKIVCTAFFSPGYSSKNIYIKILCNLIY